MDLELRDLHRSLTDEDRFPAQEWRKGQVITFHAGPPRTADITEGGSDPANPISAVLLECCANLTAGDVIWILRTGDMRLIIAREA